MQQIPEYPKFTDISFDELKIIKNHAPICEFSKVNFIIWAKFDQPQITKINNNLCILITPPNEPAFFLQPIGNNKLLETVNVCLKHIGKISRATERFIEKLSLKGHKIRCLRDQFDYIYEAKVLAELRGKKFDGKRGHLKKFKKRHPDYAFVKLNKEHEEQAMQLFEEWFAARKQSRHFPKFSYDSQKEAINKSFKHYDELKLVGGALFADNQMKGFTIGFSFALA